MEGIFGLAAFGFWMFVAAAVIAGVWDGVRKREAEHETLRRMIESGKQPDSEMIDKLLGHKKQPTTSVALDLDRALSTLPEEARLCIVLGYHERMTHAEIAEFTGLPLGTVKSHIRRGSKKLQEELAAYMDPGGTTR